MKIFFNQDVGCVTNKLQLFYFFISLGPPASVWKFPRNFIIISSFWKFPKLFCLFIWTFFVSATSVTNHVSPCVWCDRTTDTDITTRTITTGTNVCLARLVFLAVTFVLTVIFFVLFVNLALFFQQLLVGIILLPTFYGVPILVKNISQQSMEVVPPILIELLLFFKTP